MNIVVRRVTKKTSLRRRHKTGRSIFITYQQVRDAEKLDNAKLTTRLVFLTQTGFSVYFFWPILKIAGEMRMNVTSMHTLLM